MFGRMMREFNDDCDVMNQYGVIMLTVGKNDKAKPVYERVGWNFYIKFERIQWETNDNKSTEV